MYVCKYVSFAMLIECKIILTATVATLSVCVARIVSLIHIVHTCVFACGTLCLADTRQRLRCNHAFTRQIKQRVTIAFNQLGASIALADKQSSIHATSQPTIYQIHTDAHLTNRMINDCQTDTYQLLDFVGHICSYYTLSLHSVRPHNSQSLVKLLLLPAFSRRLRYLPT